MREKFEFGLSIVMLAFSWGALFFLIGSTLRMDRVQLDRFFYGPKATWHRYLMAIGGFLGFAWGLHSFAERHWGWLAASYAVLVITIGYILVQYIRARHNRRLRHGMMANGT